MPGLSRVDAESEDRASRALFFKGLGRANCACEPCLRAMAHDSFDKPCWVDSPLTTAAIVKDALLSGIKSKNPATTAECILAFNERLGSERRRPEGVSDALHLGQIEHQDLSQLILEANLCPESQLVLDLAKFSLMCSWKCEADIVQKLLGAGIEDGAQDEQTKKASAQKKEIFLEDFREKLFQLRSVFRSLMRQLARLALQPESKIVSDVGLPALTATYCAYLADVCTPLTFQWVDWLLHNSSILVKSVAEGLDLEGLEDLFKLPTFKDLQRVRNDPAFLPMDGNLLADHLKSVVLEEQNHFLLAWMQETHAKRMREASSSEPNEPAGEDERVLERVAKSALDADWDGPLLDYRKAIARVCANTDGKDVHAGRMRLEWRSEWGGFPHLRQLSREDISATVNVSVRDLLKPFQPADTKESDVLADFLGSGGSLLFTGVANDFVPVQEYVRGVKFIASPSTLADSKTLRKLFADFDILLFVKNFDVDSEHCHSGFIYFCRESRSSYIVVLFADGYQTIKQWKEVGKFSDNLNRASLTSSDDARTPNQLPRFDLVAENLVHLGDKLFREDSKVKGDGKCKEELFRCKITLKPEGERKMPLSLVKVSKKMPTRKILGQFATRLGKDESHFSFAFSDGSPVEQSAEFPQEKCAAKEVDSVTWRVLEIEAQEKTPSLAPLAFDECPESLPVCLVDLKVHFIGREGEAESKSVLALWWQPMSENLKRFYPSDAFTIDFEHERTLYAESQTPISVKKVKEVLKGLDAESVSPLSLGRKYGFDPLEICVVARQVEKPKVLEVPTPEVTSAKGAPPDDVANVKEDVDKNDEAKTQEEAFFDFSQLPVDFAHLGESELLYKGHFKISHLEDRDNVVLDRFAWVTLWRKQNGQAQLETFDALKLPITNHWRGVMKGVLMTKAKFIEAVLAPEFLDKCLVLDVVLAPDPKRGQQADLAKSLELLDTSKKDSIAVLPFFNDDQTNDHWSFMLMRFDKKQGALNVLLPLDFQAVRKLLREFSDSVSHCMTMEGKNSFPYRKPYSYLRGVLSGVLGGEPFFAVVRTTGQTNAQRENDDSLRVPPKRDDVNGGGTVLLLDEEVLTGVTWEAGSTLACDLFSPDAWVWGRLAKARDLHLLVFFSRADGSRQQLRKLLSQKEFRDVAFGLVVVRLRVTERGATECQATVPALKARMEIAQKLVEKRSELAELSLSDCFSWTAALSLLDKEGKASSSLIRDLKRRDQAINPTIASQDLVAAPQEADAEKEAEEEKEKEAEPPREEEETQEKTRSRSTSMSPVKEPAKAKQPKDDMELQARIDQFAQELAKVRTEYRVKRAAQRAGGDKTLAENLTMGQLLGLNASNRAAFVERAQQTMAEVKLSMLEEDLGEGTGAIMLQRCTFCGREDFDMALCGACGVTPYCAEACLDEDLRRHQKDCRQIRLTRTRDFIRAILALPSRFDGSGNEVGSQQYD